MSKPTFTQIMADQALIERLGGTTQVARILGLRMPGGAQRVHNWKSRGIPSAIKVLHRELFLPKQRAAAKRELAEV